MKRWLLFSSIALLAFIAGWCTREQRRGPSILAASGRSNALMSWSGATNPDSVRRVVLSIVFQDSTDLYCRMGQNFVFASWKRPHDALVDRVTAALGQNTAPGFEYAIARYDDYFEAYKPSFRECN